VSGAIGGLGIYSCHCFPLCIFALRSLRRSIPLYFLGMTTSMLVGASKLGPSKMPKGWEGMTTGQFGCQAGFVTKTICSFS